MAEPAELLLIKDQYELAFHALSRGQAAEDAGKRGEALKYYTKGRQHLVHGLEVPTWGQKRREAAWDLARQLQQRMRNTLITVNAHVSHLESSGVSAADQRGRLLMDLPSNLYPDLVPNSQPSQSSVHHLYPTIPPPTWNTSSNRTSFRLAAPSAPSAPNGHTLGATASRAIAMATPGGQPPAYTPQPTSGHRSLAHGSAEGNHRAGKQTGGDANELLFIPSGVQMFFVAPNGEVSSLSHPGFLRIVTRMNQHVASSAGRPPAFLHVCEQVYPLTPDTPVLLASSGIFMFPDTLAETPGSYVGIVLSSELPAADREMFHDLLSQLVDLRIQAQGGAEAEVVNLRTKVPLSPQNGHAELKSTVPTREEEKPPLPGWSEKMAQGILSGSTRLSQGLAKGAEVTGRAIHTGGGKIREHVTPQETPSQVSPRVTRGLQVTQQATGGAVRVSRFLVNGLSTMIGQAAEKMAPHVKKHGAKLIPESMKNKQDGRPSNLDGAKHVAVSSVRGLSAVWSSLETGAKLVGKSVATETVTTVKYKYGDHAGQATDTAIQSVANVGVAAYNFDNLGVVAVIDAAEKNVSKDNPSGKPVETKEKDVLKKREEETRK